jgi:sacsin
LPRNSITQKAKPGVILELSFLRKNFPDQLAPFEGLWGYNSCLDYYHGTIFRFPLRPLESKSELQSGEYINAKGVRTFMMEYFDEARISLLYLKRVRSIEFRIGGNDNSEWCVRRQPPLDENVKFSEWVICSFTRDLGFGTPIAGKDKWWVVVEDLIDKIEHLPYRQDRKMKNVECGIAALVSSTGSLSDPNIKEPLKPRIFSTLPLPILSDLPVYIHATFSLTGDRRSLCIDEYRRELGAAAPSANSNQFHPETGESRWNTYLLEEALPELYLAFLESLGREIGHSIFDFWPQDEPPKGSRCKSLFSSFWRELPNSSHYLFPKAEVSPGSIHRRPPRLFDIQHATFDFLEPTQSNILASLLLRLDVNLVRNVPIEITSHLKNLPNANTVSGPMLRKIFKSEKGRTHLMTTLTDKTVLKTLLSCLMADKEGLGDLGGCHIVPLADGTLGTLSTCDFNSTGQFYYLATTKEIELFNFASSILVPLKFSTSFGTILERKEFRLERLDLTHISTLLQRRPSSDLDLPNETWLTEFWAFWNKNPVKSTPLSTHGVCSFNVFQASRDSLKISVKLSDIDKLPAVVEPSDEAHRHLCDKIPGLYRYDGGLMPKWFQVEEDSFLAWPSFCRLIRAICHLANERGIEVNSFVRSCLGPSDLEVFIQRWPLIISDRH